MKREIPRFLFVGGVGYVVDVASFNLLLMTPWLRASDPAYARTLALLPAMCMTYLGNRYLTWRGHGSERRREIALFLVFNIIGYLFSAGCLLVSHDLLGLTTAVADNISANVVGVGLGTVFRFLTYRGLVFRPAAPAAQPPSHPHELILWTGAHSGGR